MLFIDYLRISIISKASKASADIFVEAGNKIQFGDLYLEVCETPGHTVGCVTYVTGDGPNQPQPRMAFTGACEIGWFSNGDKDGLLIIAKEISYVLKHMQNEYRTKQCTFQCVKYSLKVCAPNPYYDLYYGGMMTFYGQHLSSKRNQNDVLRVDNLTSLFSLKIALEKSSNSAPSSKKLEESSKTLETRVPTPG
ncbi:hypothetical protein L1987_22168 [Smallanthus sonchifolius]|uniref:Uncharacterized protein n=1 Tax=Smallanthus sonchifolius TaxID=185202 RepID=A0ACB9IEA2_9ASTR|nr:hypothetical protein L1987_22168 [Smallanthus sonchifolius]